MADAKAESDEPTTLSAATSTAIEPADAAPPLAKGVVDGIYIAEGSGEPMVELAEAEMLTQSGIKGDRYARRRGTALWFPRSLVASCGPC